MYCCKESQSQYIILTGKNKICIRSNVLIHVNILKIRLTIETIQTCTVSLNADLHVFYCKPELFFLLLEVGRMGVKLVNYD